MSTESQESSIDDGNERGPSPNNISETAQRLEVRKLLAEYLEEEALVLDTLTRIPPREMSPEVLTDFQCFLLFVIGQIKEDQEGRYCFPPESLDPNNDFLANSVSSKLNGEHDELLRISCELDFPELVLVDGKLVLDEAAEAKRIEAQKDSGYQEMKRRHEERSAAFAEAVQSQRLLGGISPAANCVWKEWQEEHPRLCSPDTNRRARVFLRNHFEPAPESRNTGSRTDASMQQEYDEWETSIIEKLPEGLAAARFRYFLQNRSVTFGAFKTGEDPVSGTRVTSSDNDASISKMLIAYAKELKKASNNECILKCSYGKRLITLTVKGRFGKHHGN